MLVACRVLQGMVMGPMEGLTAVILVQTFPEHQRGLAIGLRSIGWAAGELIFYTIGGYLFEYFSWRWLFFLGIPTGIVSTVLGMLMLPQHPETRAPTVDYPGILLLGSFLVPLLLAISFGRDSETDVSTLVLLGLTTVIGGGLFMVRELRTAFPAVDLCLFRYPAFCLLCSTAFFNSMGLFGALFMVPIFLQQVMGLTPLQAGWLLLPAIPISGLSGLATGRLTDRISPPLVAIGGLLALTVIFHAFASVTALTTTAALVGYMILSRAFMDTVGIPITSLTVQTLAAEQVRMGQGLVGVVRSIGSSFGVTVTSVFFERRRALHQSLGNATYDSASATHELALRDLHLGLHEAGVVGLEAAQAALGTLHQQLDIEAMTTSFQESFLFICLCFLVALAPMFCLLSRYSRRRAPAP
jgi:EmrB/QacA subfamily drug resistance transporter